MHLHLYSHCSVQSQCTITNAIQFSFMLNIITSGKLGNSDIIMKCKLKIYRRLHKFTKVLNIIACLKTIIVSGMKAVLHNI